MTTPTTDPTPPDLMTNLIEAHAVYLHRATDPLATTGQTPNEWLEWLMISLYAGTSVYLLAAIESIAPAEYVTALKDRLAELMDGEGLSEWVGEEADRRGLDVDEMSRAAQERYAAWLAKRASA